MPQQTYKKWCTLSMISVPKEIMVFGEKIEGVAYQGWVLVTKFRIMQRAWTLDPKGNGI